MPDRTLAKPLTNAVGILLLGSHPLGRYPVLAGTQLADERLHPSVRAMQAIDDPQGAKRVLDLAGELPVIFMGHGRPSLR